MIEVLDLPDIIVSYSELDTFRQCPLKHFLLYKQRWTKEKALDSAVGKGSLWHSVMEIHYAMIKHVQEQNADAGFRIGDLEGRILEQQIKASVHALLWDPQAGAWLTPVHELIWWMYEGHLAQYGLDNQWRIMGIEHQIVTPLRAPDGTQSRYHLKAKIDLIVRDRATGMLWVVDHKSGKDLPSHMDLEIDDQFGLYTWAMREVGRSVTGTIHSANRTQRNKSFMPLETRMRRTFLNRSDKEVTNLALDAYHAAKAAYPDDPANEVRYSAPDPRSCGWKCDVKEPHLLMRKGRKLHEVMTEYGFVINQTRH